MRFPLDLLGELVAVQYYEDKTPIRLPDWKRSLEGRVLAKGPDAQDIQIRDKVVFGAAKGMESIYNGVPIRILKQNDIYAVIEE